MAPRKPWSFKGLLSVGHWPVVHWPMALVLSPSALLCPAPMLVRLPVGRVQAFCLGVRPAHSRGSQSLFVVPVEHQHDPVIFFHVRRYWRPINEKPHGRVVRIVILRREQDGRQVPQCAPLTNTGPLPAIPVLSTFRAVPAARSPASGFAGGKTGPQSLESLSGQPLFFVVLRDQPIQQPDTPA